MVVGKPRLAPEDLLTDDDLIMGGYEGEWVRLAPYNQGHKVSRDGTTAVCGRPLVMPYGWWDEFHAGIRAIHLPLETKPVEFYMAIDRRKNAQCADCKRLPDMFDLVDPVTKGQGPSFTEREHNFTPHKRTPADKLQRQRFLAKVASVARELGAEVLK